MQLWPWDPPCHKHWAIGRGFTDLETSQLPWMRHLSMLCWWDHLPEVLLPGCHHCHHHADACLAENSC